MLPLLYPQFPHVFVIFLHSPLFHCFVLNSLSKGPDFFVVFWKKLFTKIFQIILRYYYQ